MKDTTVRGGIVYDTSYCCAESDRLLPDYPTELEAALEELTRDELLSFINTTGSFLTEEEMRAALRRLFYGELR